MSFRPQVNDQLSINGVTYSIAEHPAAPGVPYGQAGRRAIVYQVAAEEDYRALKVFSRRFRTPALVLVAQNLTPYASLPGLQVCRREVLAPERNSLLLQQHPDLAYAMLMPWIEGPTWMEALVQKQVLTPEESLTLARSLAAILAQMEEQGLAHCDLSGPNVMLPPDGGVALVDVEEIYGPEFEQPEALPSGSSGYGHRTAGEGLWGPNADRFAGAVLLAEMLGWCDERVREAAWGEQYFAGGEVQQKGGRYHLLIEALREQWGESVTGLFEQSWRSDALKDCPAFEEWLAALPEGVGEATVIIETGETEINEEQVIVPEPDWKVVDEDSKSGGENAALESTAQSLYQALREQITQGNWKEAERLGQALEVLWPEYRDGKTLLEQARQGDEEDQRVEEEIRQCEAVVRSEEERLAEERKGLEEKRLALEEKLRALEEREEKLHQRDESLTETQQNLQEARRLLDAHNWQEARHQLEGLAAASNVPVVQTEIDAQGAKEAPPPRRIITSEWVKHLQEVRCLQHSPQDIKVNSVAFSPDGSLLASACTDKRIWLWRVESGDLLYTWEGHTDRVWHVDFSPIPVNEIKP
ncbi:MAG: hypothetical protein DRJ03_23590 [Chloroflexi bacterium]|nr:MAG: hypothetical protein DRJ03_23590 [Chloroflexota bacterium]